MRAQQRRFDRFRVEYNEIRPHEALNQEPPSTRYQRSTRCFPSRLPEVEYPDHFHVATAYPNGVISFRGIQWSTTHCLAAERLG